jgi:alpha-beta hydrolase superfamily lysophospholipase
MRRLPFLIIFCFIGSPLSLADTGFEEVSFETTDGGMVYANLYGEGNHAVVLAHGAVFDKESWHPLAVAMAEQGLQVLAIDFRGYGKSKAGRSSGALHLDLLAGMAFLEKRGIGRVSLLGASMGGAAASQAAVKVEAGQLYKLILLAPARVSSPKRLQGDKLFIVSKGDGLHSSVLRAYQKASDPKRLLVLNGNSHAQHIFKTRHGVELENEILEFLGE